MLDRLDRLRHYTVISRNDQDNDIRGLGTAGTHHCKRFVTRCIEKHYTTRLIRIVSVRHHHAVGTNVLSDAASLAFSHIFRTNGIEQRCLTVIDVSHHRDDRSSRKFDVVRVSRDQLFEFLLDHHFFERHKTQIKSVFESHLDGHFFADRLIERRKYTALDEKLNDVSRRNAQSLGKFANGCSLSKSNRADLGLFTAADLIKDALLNRPLPRCVEIAFGKSAALIVLALASAAATTRTSAVVRRWRVGHLRSRGLAGGSAKLRSAGSGVDRALLIAKQPSGLGRSIADQFITRLDAFLDG